MLSSLWPQEDLGRVLYENATNANTVVARLSWSVQLCLRQCEERPHRSQAGDPNSDAARDATTKQHPHNVVHGRPQEPLPRDCGWLVPTPSK